MTRSLVLLSLILLASATSSCAGTDEWPTRAEDLDAIHDPRLMLPPGSAFTFITVTSGAGAWTVRAGVDGVPAQATSIAVTAGTPLVMLLRSASDVTFEIPACRIATRVTAGEPKVAWFVPVTPGSYPVLVSTPSGRCDGLLEVRPGAAESPR